MQNEQFVQVLNVEEALAKVDQEAWKLFTKGYPLRVWRNSSPHNWWIGNPRNPENTEFHWGERERPGPLFFATATKLPNDKAQRVSYGRAWMLSRPDEGMPVSDTWKFSQELYTQLVLRWEEAKRCAAEFNAEAETVPLAPSQLNPRERELAAMAKRKGLFPMYPADAQAMLTLTRMGLVKVTPEGYARPTKTLLKTAIPRVDEHIDVRLLGPSMARLVAKLVARLVADGLDLEHSNTTAYIHQFGQSIVVHGELYTTRFLGQEGGEAHHTAILKAKVGGASFDLANIKTTAPNVCSREYFGARRDAAVATLQAMKMQLQELDVAKFSAAIMAEYRAQGLVPTAEMARAIACVGW